MITKKQFCEIIIKKLHNPRHEIMDSSVYESPNIAVCMECLGMIKSDEAKNYASQVSGIFLTADNDNILTIREMINILPE
jgi:hypothetical protein